VIEYFIALVAEIIQ